MEKRTKVLISLGVIFLLTAIFIFVSSFLGRTLYWRFEIIYLCLFISVIMFVAAAFQKCVQLIMAEDC